MLEPCFYGKHSEQFGQIRIRNVVMRGFKKPFSKVDTSLILGLMKRKNYQKATRIKIKKLMDSIEKKVCENTSQRLFGTRPESLSLKSIIGNQMKVLPVKRDAN